MAQNIPSPEDGVDAERREHLALRVHRYVAEIETILTSLHNEAFEDVTQMQTLRRELVSTAKQLRDAEAELDRVQKQTTDAQSVGAIDFAAARDEVERRLDRLRRARGSD